MLFVRFEAQDDRYRRVITFPDGSVNSEDNVSFPLQWHTPEPYQWIRPLYEFSRSELVDVGRAIAGALLGTAGVQFLEEAASSALSLPIVVEENPQLPTVARVPWELAFADDRFLATDSFTPIIRRPSHLRPVTRLTIHSPLRMALISASPNDQSQLMVEDELITVAFALDEPMAAGRLVVDEIMNCTRAKLLEALRGNRYDIVYFTGHGSLQGEVGSIVLELDDGSTDLMSADDFAISLRSQKGLGLLFLNCCNAAAVGAARSASWQSFGDVARKAMRQGAPEVIATQSAIFDGTGRKVMKTFFAELCREDGFDAAAALATARSDVENDQSQFHDFYQFVHLSALAQGACREVIPSVPEQPDRRGAESDVLFHTPNRMEIGRNFVGRFSYISRLEEAWWSDDVKVVGIHGLGGIGKTFFCARMEQRARNHHLPAKSLPKSIWIDFREGTGSTLSGFLRQLDGIARDVGFQTFNRVLDDHEAYPSPLEKFRPWFMQLTEHCHGRALLILDNLESAIDEEGRFRDPELGAWFVELLVRTPGWKVLVTCRYRFEFFPGGRCLAAGRWLHLTEMGITERLALINRDSELRKRDEADKRQILKTVGGHPYIIKLVADYLRTHPELPEALRLAGERTAEYAQLDWFLSLLTPDELDWLLVAVLFPEPKSGQLMTFVKMIRDDFEHGDGVEGSFNAAVRRLSGLSLAGSDDDGLHVHPLIASQLLSNQASRHRQPEERIDATRRAIAILFLDLAQDKPRQQKALLLQQGADAALAQSDSELLKVYLQDCAAVFHGCVPASIFADLVRRAEGALLAAADEAAFYTLGFCAQTLFEMRHFKAATDILTRHLAHGQLPPGLRGKVIATLGTIFLGQRRWPQALESFQQALEWDEQAGQYHELGSTWHQIGIVYWEQGQWLQALESYQKALDWKERSGQHHELGATWHQIGIVYGEQRQWLQALESYQKALDWNEQTGQHHQLGATWHQIGRMHEEQRQWLQALESYQKALDWKERSGQRHGLGSTWHQIGIVYWEQRQWPQALESYQKALAWMEQTGQHHQLGKTWHQIGIVYWEQRQWPQALESYHKALDWKERSGQHHQLGSTWNQIGMVYEEQQDFAAALQNYLQAWGLCSEAALSEEAAIVLHSLRRLFSLLTAQDREEFTRTLPQGLQELLAGEAGE